MKRLTLLFIVLSLAVGLSAAKIHKVGIHPKVVTVADNRYTISEFENASGSDAVGRTAAVLTIAEAVTLLDGHGGIIQVENETAVDADLTVPSNVMLILPPTAVFRVAATKTLTINCQVQGIVTNTGGGSVAYGTSYSSPTSFPGPVHEYYVDGGRTDSYTADGSITRPYSTIKLATDAINADVLVHGTAGTGAAANYRVHVGAGTYAGNLTITGPRYLRIEGSGVVISGTILINSGVGSYDRIEFVGTESGRSEKGPAMTISGKITAERTNDSLIYVSFNGCLISGQFEATTSGTWVLQYRNCRVNGAITGTLATTAHTMRTILIEAYEFNEFVGTVSGIVSFYNCNGADMYCTINTTPYYENRFTHTSFNGSVSIIPQVPSSSALIYVDEISYRSLAARTPTITGATYSILEAVPLVSYALRVDCERVDSYTEDGSIGRPYKTIVSALAKVNADVGKSWVITVGAGTYSGHLTITGPRHLKIIGAGGVTISGNILINSGVGAYDRIEFVGTETGFAEKGPSLTLSGTITCTRSNDSLIYLSFKGCLVSGALATTTDGTWVLQYENCRVNGAITGTFSASGHPAILLISHGWNEFAGAISGKLAFYDANGSDFYGAISTTPYYASKFRHCSFNSTVSIVPASPADSATQYLDLVSYKSLLARTPTLTGAAISILESYGGGTVATSGNAVVDTNSGSVHTSTFTLTNVALTLAAAGAGVGFGNVKLYDFPQGYIYIIGAVSDLAITSADADLGNDWDGDIALGTTADDNGTLAGTEVNIIPSTATPQAAAKATTGDAVSTATEHAIIDGTTAFDLYLNLLADAADIADASTAPVAISGTITVTWINLGDN